MPILPHLTQNPNMSFINYTEVPDDNWASYLLFNLNPVEEDVRHVEEASEHPVAHLHSGGEDDGDVLQGHLVEPLALDHVLHVDEDVLDQTPVDGGQLPHELLHSLYPSLRRRVRGNLRSKRAMIASIFTDFADVLIRYLFEAGHELGREYGIGELSQELFEHARHDGWLVVAEVDARPPRAERVAKLGLLRFDTRGAVDALLHEPCKVVVSFKDRFWFTTIELIPCSSM